MTRNKSEQHLDRVFGALSDRTRRHILERLTRGNASVSDLAEPFSMSLPAILKHLRVLEEVGLVRQQKNGRVKRVDLNPAQLKSVSDWISRYSRYWEIQFDALEDFISDLEKEKRRPRSRRSKSTSETA